jgi:hypothetical protein
MEETGNILYSIINEIGKKKIQSDIALDIGLSRQHIQMILAQCEEHMQDSSDKSIGSLCEALLHFMLTAGTLPSVRKVRIDNIDLDIVIPNLHTLRKFPDKAIVIQISKDAKNIIKDHLKNVIKIQPNVKNLWVVSKRPLLADYINYVFESGNNATPSLLKRNFQDIILDIDTFLEQTKDRSFRFFH